MDDLSAMLRNLDRKDVRELHLRVGSRPALLQTDGQVKAISGLALDFKGMLNLVKGTPVGALVPRAVAEGSTERVVLDDRDYAVTVYKRGVDLQIRIRPVAGITRPMFQGRRRLKLNLTDSDAPLGGSPPGAQAPPPSTVSPSSAVITTEVSGDDALARVFGRSLTPESLKAAELPPSPNVPWKPVVPAPSKEGAKATASYPAATQMRGYSAASAPPRHSQKTRPRVAAAELPTAPSRPRSAVATGASTPGRTGTTEPYYRLVGVVSHARKIGSKGVLLRAGAPVKFRSSEGFDSSGPPLADGAVAQMVGHLMTANHEETLAARGFVCFTLTLRESGPVRVHVSVTSNGLQASLLLIAEEPPDTGDLSIPDALTGCLDASGLVVVSAPRGHGKTTTLAALIKRLSSRRAAHTLMLSEHVEIPVGHHRGLVTQRPFDGEFPPCAERLREGRTLDVDVVVIDELRGSDAILAALHASASGHLVVVAVPALSAANTLDRLLNPISESKRDAARALLADHLLMVSGQRLLRRADGKGHVAAWEWFRMNAVLRKAMHDADGVPLTDILARAEASQVAWLQDSVAALVSTGQVSARDAQGLVAWDVSNRRSDTSVEGIVHRMGGIFRRKATPPKSP